MGSDEPSSKTIKAYIENTLQALLMRSVIFMYNIQS